MQLIYKTFIKLKVLIALHIEPTYLELQLIWWQLVGLDEESLKNNEEVLLGQEAGGREGLASSWLDGNGLERI